MRCIVYYSDRYKTNINIEKPLIKNIQAIKPYHAIQVITNNATIYKLVRAIIADKYPNIFWSNLDAWYY